MTRNSIAGDRNHLRPRAVYGYLALATILSGLALRLVPLQLPSFVMKWGGSVLWAVMVYWLIAAILPSHSPEVTAILAAGFAVLVELSRLYHSPGLDAFRLTLAGKLLLGRVFSTLNIVAYWAAILAADIADRCMIRAIFHRQRLGTGLS